MGSEVIVNVRDANADDVVVPDTSANSPNTGYLDIDSSMDVNTSASGSMPVIGIAGIVIMLVIIVSTLITKRHYIRLILRRNRLTMRSLVVLAIIASILSFVGLKELNNSYNLASAEGNDANQQAGQTQQRNIAIPEDALAISTAGVVLNVDLGDEPVFDYAKDTVTVTTPTASGYTLVAYIDGDTKDLANTTNAEVTDAKITGLTSSGAQALTENTWGLALEQPGSKDSEVFYSLPTDDDAPFTINANCIATEAGDKTDVYIGAYVTPELPVGTYSGVTINYVAVANVAVDEITVNYHGNGLFFDEGQARDENTVVYGTYRCAINNDSQELCGIANKIGAYENIFGSENSSWYSQIANPEASSPNDTLEFSGEDEVKEYLFANHETYKDQTVDLYATKNYTIHFDANGGEGQMVDQQITSGELTANTFTRTDYFFNGWNTDADGNGTSYSDRHRLNQIAKPGETVTLYAQWTACFVGNICYKQNGDDVVGTMGIQEASSYSSVDLHASNFKRDGYGFAGWNTKPDYSGRFYGANQTITVPSTPNGLSLYAIWVQSIDTIQNWNGCTNLTQASANGTPTLSSVTALTDERDNNTYAVARLADGNCWMIENLRLDDTPELTVANTNNPSLPLTNDYDTASTSNHLSPSTDYWCGGINARCYDQSKLGTYNVSSFTNNTTGDPTGDVYSYGNYYNWYSATAGHGKYGSSYASGYTAPGDICPIGWHLPSGGTTDEYYNLTVAVNGGTDFDYTTSNKFRSYPGNFVFSGYASDEIKDRGEGGHYWSSSAKSNKDAFSLRFTNGYISTPSDNSYITKSKGWSVRCLIGV